MVLIQNHFRVLYADRKTKLLVWTVSDFSYHSLGVVRVIDKPYRHRLTVYPCDVLVNVAYLFSS